MVTAKTKKLNRVIRKKKARVVSFNCVLRDRFGHVISSSFNNEVIVSDQQPPSPNRNPAANPVAIDGLVRGLGDIRKGEKRQVNVGANDAYGFYDRDLVLEVPRRKFPEENLQIGANVLAEAGDGRPRLYRVVALSHTHVTLDGNHPLAGQDLVFDIETVDVREATPDELAEHRVSSGSERGEKSEGGGRPPRPDFQSRGRHGYLH